MINTIGIDNNVNGNRTIYLAIEKHNGRRVIKYPSKMFRLWLPDIRTMATLSFYLLSLNFLYGLTPKENLWQQNQELEEATAVQSEVDSLKKILRRTPPGAGKAEIYGQLCATYVGELGEGDVARLYADSVKWLADKFQDESLFAASEYYYGLVDRYDGNYTQALDRLQRTIDYCNTSGDSSRMVSTLFQMALIHQYLGDYEESLIVSYRVMDLYAKEGSHYGMAISFMHLGNLFLRMKDNDKAIEMFDQALTIFDTLEASLKVKMSMLRVLINLGNSYRILKQYEKARKFYDQSLLISRLLGSKRTTATTLNNIGSMLRVIGQYDSALVYQLKALAIREQTSQKDKIVISLLNIGGTYTLIGDYSLANQFLLRGLSMAKEFQSKPLIRDAYEELSALYSTQKNFQKAYDYHQLFAVMKDSVLNELTATQVSELATKYKTAEKDKQIALLAKEKEIQKKEGQRQAALNKAYIAGLVFIIVVGALIFYIIRQRLHLLAKNNEIKEVDFKRQVTELQMKALRAQINPHFLFNCMNAINLMILKGQTENASLYLAKFSRLVRLILENAEASAVTLESEMALLESYMQLEELRLPGRFGYRISVDESIGLRNTYLPSMVLQPVVENAIWHGIVHKEDEAKGNISIDVRQHEDELLCTIEDNGVGRDKAQQMRDKSVIKNRSLGIKITEERLRLRNRRHNGECIQITDLKDRLNHAIGTRVTIHIPIAEQHD